MSAGTIDCDFAQHMKALGPPPPRKPVTSVFDYRATANVVIKSLMNYPVPEDIVETKHTVKSYDGAEIVVYRMAKRDTLQATESQPALIYLHGGGVVACPIDDVGRNGVYKLVEDMGVQAFAVEYRLAPEFPFPTPVEDCYATLQWIQSDAAGLNVDPARLGLYGSSGGGCLVAAVSLMARDRGLSPKIAKQFLIYPMLDDRSTVTSAKAWEESVAEMRSQLSFVWPAYLGAETACNPDAQVSPYGSPARAESLADLPPTYIDCGSLDAFRNESLLFATRLAEADVDVEMHLYAGVPHIFDLLAPKCRATINAMENRKRAIDYM